MEKVEKIKQLKKEIAIQKLILQDLQEKYDHLKYVVRILDEARHKDVEYENTYYFSLGEKSAYNDLIDEKNELISELEKLLEEFKN